MFGKEHHENSRSLHLEKVYVGFLETSFTDLKSTATKKFVTQYKPTSLGLV